MDELDDAARAALEQDDKAKQAAEMMAEIQKTTVALYRAAMYLKMWENALIHAGYSANEAFSMASMMQAYFLEGEDV